MRNKRKEYDLQQGSLCCKRRPWVRLHPCCESLASGASPKAPLDIKYDRTNWSCGRACFHRSPLHHNLHLKSAMPAILVRFPECKQHAKVSLGSWLCNRDELQTAKKSQSFQRVLHCWQHEEVSSHLSYTHWGVLVPVLDPVWLAARSTLKSYLSQWKSICFSVTVFVVFSTTLARITCELLAAVFVTLLILRGFVLVRFRKKSLGEKG